MQGHAHDRIGDFAVTEIIGPDAAPYHADHQLGGHAGIEKRVTDAYEKWVKEKGNVFRLRDGVDGHHGTVKLRWEMLPASGGPVISIGFDFLVLGDDGRIRTGYQFIEA